MSERPFASPMVYYAKDPAEIFSSPGLVEKDNDRSIRVGPSGRYQSLMR